MAASQDHLETQLRELQDKYDVLSRRIAARNTEIGRTLDLVRKQILEEELAEWTAEREQVAGQLAALEAQVAAGPPETGPAAAEIPAARAAQPVRRVSRRVGWALAGLAVLAAAAGVYLARRPEPARVACPPDRVADAGQDLDDAMVQIPATTFVMGTQQTGQAEIAVDAFALDRYEVTNLQYQRFVEQTGHASPAGWAGASFPAGQAYHPVVGVTWLDAAAYCAWAGKRLPAEAEWELACRGAESRGFPWGDAWAIGLANTAEAACDGPAAVGSYAPAGDSPFGIADLAGNVFEWVSSAYRAYPYRRDDGREDPADRSSERLIRGGSWQAGQEEASCAFRGRVAIDDAFEDLGFRCAGPAAP